ncbi:glycosyl hydrolase, family 88 [Rhodotorula toruloides]|uniref:Glycosyl hydrolase, family 88 n=1 Tax=Rhodotorula toruloides TaxID=5286 RepID=A0A511KNA3_RHOTO|nr:glycosyl hydrolase, family 88 [Rhodotorula toruloides]
MPAGEPASLWADFISMVPPFLAYYGVVKQDRSLLLEAYNQIKLYRSYLRTSSGSWKHVVQGDFTDSGLWSTGNGWAAHGIARVLATVKASQWNETLASEARDLGSWGVEIVKAAFGNVKSDGLLPNYYDSASGSSFSDASGSALLAAAAYRLAQLGALTNQSVIHQAAGLRAAVNGKVDRSSGWVAPVVNPFLFKQQASQSPEGEAFVLLLQAAWEDCTSTSAS